MDLHATFEIIKLYINNFIENLYVATTKFNTYFQFLDGLRNVKLT